MKFIVAVLTVALVAAVQGQKPGSCPKPGGFGICLAGCMNDAGCSGAKKCCSNGCGNICMDPVGVKVTRAADCSSRQCPDGSKCVMQQVQCIMAPCPPLPTCVKETAVADCSTRQCPAGSKCVMQQVFCIMAPCPPLPTCVKETRASDCSTLQCPAGTSCYMQQVMCIRAPCPPIAMCR